MHENSATSLFLRIDRDMKRIARSFEKSSFYYDIHDFMAESKLKIFGLKGGMGDGLYLNNAKQTMTQMLRYERCKKRNPITIIKLINWMNDKKHII